MRHPSLFLLLASLLVLPCLLHAEDEGPAISITSPDAAITFAYGSVQDHCLIWDSKNKILLARVVFTDAELGYSQAQEDQHTFRLPGVNFDEAKGLFYAISAKGETIPVAQIKKVLFLKTIEVLPNANVRIEHPHGNVTVVLEAVSPDDPAMHASSSSSGGDSDSR
ncbi:MAG TPA: hypothetical protein VL981_04170 [Candidatus Methylacidiphilales bacterium]|nr:hypothetical protein [Candidatus Methylacidiphilales bacterium]